MKTNGIVTGDIVHSTHIVNKDALIHSLKGIFLEMVKKKMIKRGKYDIYRGDSFQWVATNPSKTLRGMLIFRAMLKVSTPDDENELWDARVAMGLGEVSFITKDVRQSYGPAFILSGRTLDKMKPKERMKIASQNKDLDDEFNTALLLAEHIISRWSKESAETAIAHWLHHETQKEMAKKRFKISQPAVSKRFKAAGIEAIDKLLVRFEKKIENSLTHAIG